MCDGGNERQGQNPRANMSLTPTGTNCSLGRADWLRTSPVMGLAGQQPCLLNATCPPQKTSCPATSSHSLAAAAHGLIGPSHVNPFRIAPQALPPMKLDPGILIGSCSTTQNARPMQRAASNSSLLMPSSHGSQSAYLDADSMPEEKRNSRLFKNREAAKACRRKKKEYVQCLEQRMVVLEHQNQQLIDELRGLRALYAERRQKPDRR